MSKNQSEIRYGEAFKLPVVRAVAEGGLTFAAAQRRHGIKGAGTVQRWVRPYGKGMRGRIVRVEPPAEQGDLARLKLRLRRVERALATTQVARALERKSPGLPCLRAGITEVAGFKKKRLSRRASSQKAVPQTVHLYNPDWPHGRLDECGAGGGVSAAGMRSAGPEEFSGWVRRPPWTAPDPAAPPPISTPFQPAISESNSEKTGADF